MAILGGKKTKKVEKENFMLAIFMKKYLQSANSCVTIYT